MIVNILHFRTESLRLFEKTIVHALKFCSDTAHASLRANDFHNEKSGSTAMQSKFSNVFANFLNSLQAMSIVPRPIRAMILKARGVSIGYRSSISHHCHLGPNLTVGNNSFINVECLIETGEPVTIGDGVHLAMRVTILTTSHEIGPPEHRCGGYKRSSVIIEDGAWVGASVTILPGVRIGKGCVVAAGAVVNCNTEPNVLYGGVPARKLRAL